MTIVIAVNCEVDTHLRCSNDDCIDLELLCDDVPHCLYGEDEFNCPQNEGLTSDGECIVKHQSLFHCSQKNICTATVMDLKLERGHGTPPTPTFENGGCGNRRTRTAVFK